MKLGQVRVGKQKKCGIMKRGSRGSYGSGNERSEEYEEKLGIGKLGKMSVWK